MNEFLCYKKGGNAMRNIWVAALITLLMLCFTGIAQATPKVTIDGKTLTFDVPPTIENDRTLVPLRAIFEALGAEVQWDNSSQTVIARKNNVEIRLAIGGQAFKNGQMVTLDVPAKIINDRTMVPLRFVSEALGAEVVWDENTESIFIYAQTQIKPKAEQFVKWTPEQVIEAFKNAGLEAENVRPMTKDDFGLAPMIASKATRFYIPSLGEGCGGRLYSFNSLEDLEIMKNYYVSAGKKSAIFFSWVFTKDNILVQINGDLNEGKAKQYEATLSTIK